jgi:hypothetical protein
VESGRREGGLCGASESDGGKKGNSDLSRSRASFLENEQSPKDGRTFALMCWCRRWMEANVRLQVHGERANDCPKVGERLLP